MNASIDRRDAPYGPGETALLLIDMQRAWLEPGLDPSHPDRPEDHYFYVETRERVIPNAARLLADARNHGIEVIHTIIQSLTRDGRDRSLDHKLTPIHLPPDDGRARVIDALAPIEDEIVLTKTSSGVFNSTNLNYVLRNIGIRFLVIAGVLTDQCVDLAVRDGADLGYAVTCVRDACAAPSALRHDAALAAFGGYCWLANTETVSARFRSMSMRSAR